ncbi:MAG: HAMP domain-containing histidine kinase [Provencibacterium sp.]|jgi:OmpR-family two-component system manganese-sensing sensor histidine kinase|nr:HAMP domain-containing histidine kinase [Provencibacterium sp.]
MLSRLRLRLTLTSALTTAAVLCVSIWLLTGAFERKLLENARTAFEGSLSAAVYQLQNERSLSWSWLSRMETDHQLVIAVWDNGKALRYPGAYRPRTGRKELISLLCSCLPPGSLAPEGTRYSVRRFTLTGREGEAYLAAAAAIPAKDGSVRTLYLIQDLQGYLLGGMRWFCLLTALLGTLALTALCWWLSGRAVLPVTESWQRQNEFIAAASHELRSPLGVLRANAAALIKNAAPAEKGQAHAGPEDADFIGAIDRECTRLGRLVDDLLTLANADAGRLSLRPGPVEPAQLLKDTAQACRPLAAEKGICLQVSAPPPLPVITADEQRLQQLLFILLDNALQYTPAGGIIRLSAENSGRRIILNVSDSGPGIPKEEREKVFLRFYRADRARGSGGHYGLGLSIAADIARLHAGALFLSETPGGGLTVSYSQPVSPASLRPSGS